MQEVRMIKKRAFAYSTVSAANMTFEKIPLPGILCWLRVCLVHEAGLRDHGLYHVVQSEALVPRGLDVDVDKGDGEGERLAAGRPVEGRREGEVIGAGVAAAVDIPHLSLLYL